MSLFRTLHPNLLDAYFMAKLAKLDVTVEDFRLHIAAGGGDPMPVVQAAIIANGGGFGDGFEQMSFLKQAGLPVFDLVTTFVTLRRNAPEIDFNEYVDRCRQDTNVIERVLAEERGS